MPNLPQTKDMLIIVCTYFQMLVVVCNTLEIAIVSHTCYLTTGILNNVCLAKHNDFIV